MKIRILGTGYGECKIKKFVSKDYRRKGGMIVDGKLLFDAPGDIFDTADELGFSDMFDSLAAVFISHSHPGHFSPEALIKLARRRILPVLADKEVLSLIPDCENIKKIAIAPYMPIDLGAYHVIPLPAAHKTANIKERCLNFLIVSDKKLLYLLDGSLINSDYFWLLRLLKPDCYILDCAKELMPPDESFLYHGGYESLSMTKKMLIGAKAADEKTRFVLSHIPTSKKRSIHEELSALAKEDGFITAYDGYFLNI